MCIRQSDHVCYTHTCLLLSRSPPPHPPRRARVQAFVPKPNTPAYDVVVSTADRAASCFYDIDGPILINEDIVAIFDEGGSWRFCLETRTMVQIMVRDARGVTPHSDKDHDANEDVVDVDALFEGILDADREESDRVDIIDMLDDIFAEDRALFEHTHMQVIVFVSADESIPAAVEVAVEREQDMVEALIAKIIADDARALFERTHMQVIAFVSADESIPAAVEVAVEREQDMVKALIANIIATDEQVAELAATLAVSTVADKASFGHQVRARVKYCGTSDPVLPFDEPELLLNCCLARSTFCFFWCR